MWNKLLFMQSIFLWKGLLCVSIHRNFAGMYISGVFLVFLCKKKLTPRSPLIRGLCFLFVFPPVCLSALLGRVSDLLMLVIR